MTSNHWNFKRVLHTLAATQEIPRHTRLHSRGSTRVPHTSRGAPFPPRARDEGSFRWWPGKNSGRSRRISRGGALHRKGERYASVVPPFQASPRCLSPFQRNLFSLHCLDFHAEDRLPPRWHVRQPCAKASCDSPVGKPRGKASWKILEGKPQIP